MSGQIIGVEGPDGAGKETQARNLVARFAKEGYVVKYFDFPQYEETIFGGMVGKMLTGEYGPMKNISPYLASLPYALDRWMAVPEINQVRDKGGIAVLNLLSFLKLNNSFQAQFVDLLILCA